MSLTVSQSHLLSAVLSGCIYIPFFIGIRLLGRSEGIAKRLFRRLISILVVEEVGWRGSVVDRDSLGEFDRRAKISSSHSIPEAA
jgi:hypothetical protein